MHSASAECVITLIQERLPLGVQLRQIEPGNGLAELGITSMLVIAIVLEAAQRLALDLARLDEAMSAPVTVADLIALIERIAEPCQ